MSINSIISKWEENSAKNNASVLAGMNKLDAEELNRINGGSDVNPETTPLCIGIITGLTYSIRKCK